MKILQHQNDRFPVRKREQELPDTFEKTQGITSRGRLPPRRADFGKQAREFRTPDWSQRFQYFCIRRNVRAPECIEPRPECQRLFRGVRMSK
jgi:hypothetical protein